MLKVLLARLHQKHRTMGYPDAPPPPMPQHFRGRPIIDISKCDAECRACESACPTSAITLGEGARVDLGRCLFCADCQEACPKDAIRHSDDYRLTTRKRSDLMLPLGDELKLAQALDGKLRRLFGRSLKLRQVSAGGCNACEMDTNVLNTVGWDLGRFGIQFVASPRHADGLLITGPVSQNMKLALEKTWRAVPEPRLVIALGACAISGGPYINHPEANNGAEPIVPVDLFIPGCPPHPLTILDGLLRLVGRLEQKSA